jgi:SNF2 family DNA or RNA helicase
MNLEEELKLPFPLRPYQEVGVEFLINNSSALLGDDMGLGKTVQVIVALKSLYEKNGIFKCLIVVPNSLKTNWRKEFNQWFPDANLTILHGDLADRNFQLESSTGFILCTYEQMRSSFQQNHTIGEFDYLIFDEIQKIKNSTSQAYMAAYVIKSKHIWGMSGTPLENSPQDVVNIFSIIKPFLIQEGIEQFEISQAITPFMLRRLKSDVLEELPELIEENLYIDMHPLQQKEYNEAFNKRLNIDKKDSSQLLSLITELKKICNFSSLYNVSSKVEALEDIIGTVLSKNEKIIIFSQYVKTLEYIQDKISYSTSLYHGGLNSDEKDKMISDFKTKNENNILLMSLMAGGVGLNLQEASTIVLFDRWWNPAVESQAIARAHRMGRNEPVHAIKFITTSSIEEKIVELLHDKKEMFDLIIEGAVERGKEKNLLQLLNLEIEKDEKEN